MKKVLVVLLLAVVMGGALIALPGCPAVGVGGSLLDIRVGQRVHIRWSENISREGEVMSIRGTWVELDSSYGKAWGNLSTAAFIEQR